jgi:class 3 adenylate cyclase/tetratricopeptide (TPR) repeat protein
MTVMFCDLVGSTPLAERLDPEDFRELLTGYQEVCAGAIERFNGYTALFVGDGVVAYFGYPHAHEDDAQRSIHAALGILAGLKELNTRLQASFGVTIDVRIGLHSGVVVVAENAGQMREQLEIVGETPHIAQRLESIAPEGTIVVSETTLGLVEGYFEAELLGERELKGISRPVAVHRILRPTGAVGRLEAAKLSRLTPLVGRESELERLREAWRQAADGRGTIVEVTGEAGIGKSRLVHAAVEMLDPEPAAMQVWQCSAHHASTSLHPVIRLLERELPLERSASSGSQLELIADAAAAAGLDTERAVPLLADLLSVRAGGDEDRRPLSPRDTRTATLRMLESMLVTDSNKHPLLLVVEDLHWADPTTIEFLWRVMRHVPNAPVMCVLTFRSEFAPRWLRRRAVMEVALGPLSAGDVREMATLIRGNLDRDVLEWLESASDGVPLFVEEVSRMLELRARAGAVAGVEMGSLVPPTLDGLLVERLDRLGDLAEAVDVAAVLGREFDREVLEALDPLEGRDLGLALTQLGAHGVVRPVGDGRRFEFTHTLLQEAAYQRMLRRRRRALHGRVAEALVAKFPQLAEREPEVVAGHWSGAGQPGESVSWWHAAGVRALERAAFVEAAEHFRRGSEALDQVDPDGQDALQRLDFTTHRGAALQAGRGYGAPGVGEAYAEARSYSERVGDDDRLVPVIRGQWMFHLVRGEYGSALERADEMLSLATRHASQELHGEGHLYSGLVHMYLANFESARNHLEQAIPGDARRGRADEIYEAQGDTGVGALAYLSMVLWQMGYPDESRARSDRSLELADRVAGPVTRAQAFFMRTVLHLSRGEADEFSRWVENTRAFSGEYNIGYWRTLSSAYSAWRQAWAGELATGTERLKGHIDAYLASGSRLALAHLYVLLADLRLAAGDPVQALDAIAAGEEYVVASGEEFSHSELYRCKARALMMGAEPDPIAASAALGTAAEIAAGQNARLPQLRALAQLVGHQHKLGLADAGAADRLAALCDWFGPECRLADVTRARGLLEPEAARP